MSKVAVLNYSDSALEPVTYEGEPVTFDGDPVTTNQDQAGYLRESTLRIDDSVEGRSTASFNLVNVDGDAASWIGSRIEIKSDDVVIFGGIVEEATSREDSFGRVWQEVTAVDYAALLDRHRVAGAFEGMAAGQVVRDILTDSAVSNLHQEGLNADGVDDGPVVEKIVFSYVTATKALEELAQYAGFHWHTTPQKGLVFRPRSAATAPFGITDWSRNYRNLSVKHDKLEYRNRQYIRAGKDLTDVRTETFTGDGETRTWVLAYPVGEAPTVTVDGASRTVGIQGVDDSTDFFWQKDERVITQNEDDPVLTSSDSMAVMYQGLFPILVVTENEGQVEERADAEGTSGIYENVVQDATLDQRTNAIAKAEALLARFGQFNAGITFDTDDDVESKIIDLRAGDVLRITKDAHGLNGEGCLVESVSLQRVDPHMWRATVTAMTGNQTTSWLRYWRALSEQQQGLAVRENEVVIIGGETTSFTDNQDFTDSLSVSHAAPESRVGYATVGFSEAA